MEQISLTPQLEIKQIITLGELYQSLQILMNTVSPETKVFANIKEEVETQIQIDLAYPFLDDDFFDDDEIPADLSENHDKYLYDYDDKNIH
ncbi:hypothetical protein BGP_6036 [Beggiatoa sp. PS]|nr:hypothetical protein BGP_6036 [Beggiatoa sp. PS]